MYVETVEELGEIYNILAGLDDKYRVSEGYDEYAMLHERKHRFAAELIGAPRVLQAVSFSWVQSKSGEVYISHYPFTMPFGLETTKLGALSLMAAPYDMSPGDKADMASAGVHNVQELGGLILDHNLRSDTKLYVPLSFTSGRKELSVRREADAKAWSELLSV